MKFVRIIHTLFAIFGAVLLLFALPEIAAGQSSGWTLYSRENTLFPALCISDMVADQNGHIWIASYGGLVCLEDGHWILYNEKNSEIVDDGLLHIAMDCPDRIWVASTRGVFRFDGQNRIDENGYQRFLRQQNQIEDLELDGEGNVWIGIGQNYAGGGGGLFRFDGDRWASFSPDIPDSSAYLVVTCIESDADGSVWLGTQKGLARFDGKSWTVYDVENSGIPANFVRTLAIDGYGNKWLGFYDEGLARYDGRNWIVYNRLNSWLPGNDVTGIDFDAKGRAWIGTTRGLACFDFAGAKWQIFTTANSDLADDHISSVLVEKDIVYAGSLMRGLSVWDGVQWTILNSDTPNYLPDNYINDLEYDAHKRAWIATNSGLACFDGKHWTSFAPKNSPLPSAIVHDIAFDRKGVQWLATELGLVKKTGESWEIFTTTNSGLPLYDKVTHLAIDEQDALWLATSQPSAVSNIWEGSGVARFDGASWQIYNTENSQIPGNHVSCIAADGKGNVWIGTGFHGYRGHGLVKFDGANWTPYSVSNSQIPSDYISALVCDSSGVVWVGTKPGRGSGALTSTGGGLARFDGSNWTVYNPGNSPLPGHAITALQPDTRSGIWIGLEPEPASEYRIGSSGGLVYFNGDTWQVYQTANSPLASDGISCLAMTEDEALWIGCMPLRAPSGTYQSGGIAIFDPMRAPAGVSIRSKSQAGWQASLRVYPNPGKSKIRIAFVLSRPGFVVLKIFNTLGQEAALLVQAARQSGAQEVIFDGSLLPGGVYICQLQFEDMRASCKFLLLKRD